MKATKISCILGSAIRLQNRFILFRCSGENNQNFLLTNSCTFRLWGNSEPQKCTSWRLMQSFRRIPWKLCLLFRILWRKSWLPIQFPKTEPRPFLQTFYTWLTSAVSIHKYLVFMYIWHPRDTLKIEPLRLKLRYLWLKFCFIYLTTKLFDFSIYIIGYFILKLPMWAWYSSFIVKYIRAFRFFSLLPVRYFHVTITYSSWA